MTRNDYLKKASDAYFNGRITIEVYNVLIENADIFTPSEDYENRVRALGRTFPGFGEEHTNAEWARRLGLPRNTVWRYLQRGFTVEQIAENRGIKYPT